MVGATVLAAVAGGPPDAGAPRPWTVAVAALVAGAALLLLLRRRPVLGALVAQAVCTGVQLLVGGPTGVVILVLVSLLVVGLRRPLPVAIALLGLCCGVYLAGDVLTGGFDSRVLAPLALMAAVTAAGLAVAGQRALVHAAIERAAAAERTREDEAERRVADERLRIARELHDVVAHHVAVMGVQAGAADQLMDTDPAQARAALAQVRTAGRTALGELGAVVGLLRSRPHPREVDAGDLEDDLAPAAAGLDGLPQLLDDVRTAGLRLTVVGDPRAAADALRGTVADIAAYRIVQESLTNAMRHGTGDAELTLGVTGDQLTVTTVNPLAGPGTPPHLAGSGHGLLGMRERAVLAGAELTTGPTDAGTFAVRAVFATGFRDSR
ncbi:Signal transduction histidine kinase [Klenkia soli]|uniref:histidine kinase n=1 Tax=Klenkia soli TaxID=1052260 RepID=A0A1H0G3N0_9ACTN|nr:Signal transduction histidine kinase [Klenkia soli]